MKEELTKTTFLFVGISDWEVDKIMSLDEVYLLKKAVLELYDGDEYIVKFQLQHYIPVTKIATRYYRFCSKNEVDTIFELTKELDYKSVVDYFFSMWELGDSISRIRRAGRNLKYSYWLLQES